MFLAIFKYSHTNNNKKATVDLGKMKRVNDLLAQINLFNVSLMCVNVHSSPQLEGSHSPRISSLSSNL